MLAFLARRPLELFAAIVGGSKVSAAEFYQHLGRILTTPYRPEQHYMRGPGPKWHAKHRGGPLA